MTLHNLKFAMILGLFLFSFGWFQHQEKQPITPETSLSFNHDLSIEPVFLTPHAVSSESSKPPKWMTPDPRFHPYLEVVSKTLLTTDEQQALRSFFETNALLQVAQDYLLMDVDDLFDPKLERQRIISMSYLELIFTKTYGDALLEDAIALAEDLLSINRVRDLQDVRLKQSLIGDKFKIGRILIQYQPEVWQRFVKEHTHAWQAQLIQAIELDVQQDRL